MNAYTQCYYDGAHDVYSWFRSILSKRLTTVIMLDCIHVSDSHGRLVTLQSTSAISFPKISPYTELIGNWKKLLHQFTTISSQQGNAQHVFLTQVAYLKYCHNKIPLLTCTVFTEYSLRNDASCSAAEVPLTDLQKTDAKFHTSIEKDA